MLLDNIRSLTLEPVVIAPDNRRAEDENTVWLGYPADEPKVPAVPDVAAAFHDVAAVIRDQVAESGYRGAVTFYVWHDEQAGQLRCSTRTLGPADLPFGRGYRATADPAEVIARFLANARPGFVAWADLEPVGSDDDGADPPLPQFAVWTLNVGAA